MPPRSSSSATSVWPGRDRVAAPHPAPARPSPRNPFAVQRPGLGPGEARPPGELREADVVGRSLPPASRRMSSSVLP